MALYHWSKFKKNEKNLSWLTDHIFEITLAYKIVLTDSDRLSFCVNYLANRGFHGMDFNQLDNVTLDPKANTPFEALRKAISPILISFGGRET